LFLATPLGAVQDVHWQIHRAHCNYQEVAEARRRIAADIGEVVRAFLDELVSAGRSEQEARSANALELAGSPRWCGLGHNDSKLTSGRTSRVGSARQGTAGDRTRSPRRD
jgi:hypothetical protein